MEQDEDWETKITPEREAELVYESMPRKYRRKVKKLKKKEIEWPDITRGLSNHQRMMLKKVGRGGAESRRRGQRNDRTK